VINTSHVAIHNGKLHATIEDGAIPAMLAEPVRAALHVLENAKHMQSKFLEAMSALWVRRTRQELAEFLPFADPWDPKRSRTEDENVRVHDLAPVLAHRLYFHATQQASSLVALESRTSASRAARTDRGCQVAQSDTPVSQAGARRAGGGPTCARKPVASMSDIVVSCELWM
jgi:hypothetical protein